VPDRASKSRLGNLVKNSDPPVERAYAPLGAKKLGEGEVISQSVSLIVELIKLTQYSDRTSACHGRQTRLT